MTQEITQEVQNELMSKSQDILSQAREMTISSEIENTQAATFTASLKAEIKRRKKLLEPTKDALDASKKAYQGLVQQIITPLEEVTVLVGQKVGQFVQQENARRAELQRLEDQRVRELQRREDERAAAAQAKEDARVREAQRKADEKHAAKVAAEQEAAAKAGREAAAVAPAPVIETRIVAGPVIIPQRTIAAVSAPANTTYIKRWSAKIVSLKKLCLAIAEGREPESLVAGVMPILNNRATEKKIENAEIADGVIAVMNMGTMQR